MRPWHMPAPFQGIQANPYPSPPPSYSGSPASTAEQLNGSFDISTSTMDILYNLSFSASALHSYSRPQPDENSVPDLLTISETLSASRDLATHVLDHWLSQLETVRSEHDRINNEILRARELLRRATRDAKLVATRPHQRDQLSKSLRDTKPSISMRGGAKVIWNDPPTSEADARTPLETNDSQLSSDHSQPLTITSKSGRLRFDLNTYVDESNGSQTHDRHSVTSDDELSRYSKHHHKKSSISNMALKILHRADTDIHSIEANISSMGKLFEYAEKAISEAHALVDEAIKVCGVFSYAFLSCSLFVFLKAERGSIIYCPSRVQWIGLLPSFLTAVSYFRKIFGRGSH